MSRGSANDWIFVLLLTAVVAVITALQKWRLSRSMQWPAANGRIERSEAARFHVGKTLVPGVRVYYSFTVNGEYYGGQVAKMGFSQDSQIEDFIRRFAAGTPVTLRYDPKDVDSSMIHLEDNPDLDVGRTGATLTNFNDPGPDFNDLKL